MRNTSTRRRATRGGVAYRGAPTGRMRQGRPRYGTMAQFDSAGQPLPGSGICPECTTPIRLRADGTIWAHAAGGFKVSIPKGWVACLGVGSLPTQEVTR